MTTVTLVVGPSKTAYRLHIELLRNASSVFKAAFSTDSDFKEGKDRSMALPDEDCGAIDRMVQWLCTSDHQLSPYNSRENATDRYWELAKLNVLADKYDITKLKNDIIDQLYDDRNTEKKNAFPPPFSVVVYIYDDTSERSAFRKLMIAWLTWHLNTDLFDSPNTKALLLENGEFAADLAIALGQRVGQPDRKNAFACDRAIYYEDSTQHMKDVVEEAEVVDRKPT